jgi:streptomycin 6-kinase
MELDGELTGLDEPTAVTTRLALCASRWNLHVGPPLEGGYVSHVFSCVDANGEQLVLKLVPSGRSAALEAAALRLWNGMGAVSLRDCDTESRALLLDRVVPDTPLPPGDGERAIKITSEVLGVLHDARLPDQPPFPSLADTFDAYVRRTRDEAELGTVGIGLLDRSCAAARRLCLTARETVLLHGDFLDKNILCGSKGFIAIDPMPCVGDPCSDIGFFAASHPPTRNTQNTARTLAESLGRDASRAEYWARIWAVGQACETWRSDTDELQAWVGSVDFVHRLAW